jgi:hypothetical protein
VKTRVAILTAATIAGVLAAAVVEALLLRSARESRAAAGESLAEKMRARRR